MSGLWGFCFTLLTSFRSLFVLMLLRVPYSGIEETRTIHAVLRVVLDCGSMPTEKTSEVLGSCPYVVMKAPRFRAHGWQQTAEHTVDGWRPVPPLGLEDGPSSWSELVSKLPTGVAGVTSSLLADFIDR